MDSKLKSFSLAEDDPYTNPDFIEMLNVKMHISKLDVFTTHPFRACSQPFDQT
jgi:hypothetical protein